jgi:nicotinic acid mononucleotide adenylyltransferase
VSPTTHHATPFGNCFIGRVAIACYPGSFDPPTIAHLAVVEAVLALEGIDEVHLVLSVDPLGKPGAASLEDRLAAAHASTDHLAAVGVRATSHRLLVDVAQGYDVLVLGADKWDQIRDAAWYDSPAARDDALARLPELLVVPRHGHPVPPGVSILQIDPAHAEVSSTKVREGRHDWRA